MLRFSGLSVTLSLSVRGSLSTTPPSTSQRQDVYSSAKLLAVLIILGQAAAAGGVGCLSGSPPSAADGYGAGRGEG